MIRRAASLALFSVAALLAGPAAAVPGAAFLRNNMDVRSEAMGGGADALSVGAAAVYRNPAGAARAAAPELLFSYAQSAFGSSYQGISYLDPAREDGRRVSVGAHALYHQLGAFDTVDADFRTTGTVRPYDVVAGVSLARSFGALSGGVTVKAIHQSLGSASASAEAMDVGVMSPTPVRHLSLSLSMTNLGTRVRFVSESYALPTALNAGLGYETRWARVVGDLRAPMAGGEKARFSLGTEFLPARGLALRAGYMPGVEGLSGGAGESASQFGFGLGLTMGRFGLDYALVPTAFDSVNKIAFRMNFR